MQGKCAQLTPSKDEHWETIHKVAHTYPLGNYDAILYRFEHDEAITSQEEVVHSYADVSAEILQDSEDMYVVFSWDVLRTYIQYVRTHNNGR